MCDTEMDLYKGLIAAPYKRGTSGENGYYDCYGLVQALYLRLGIVIPDQPRPAKRKDLGNYADQERLNWIPVLSENKNDPLAVVSCDPRLSSQRFALRPYNLVQLQVDGFNCHIGMVLPDKRVIHTWEVSGCAVIERLDDKWENKIVGVYRPHN